MGSNMVVPKFECLPNAPIGGRASPCYHIGVAIIFFHIDLSPTPISPLYTQFSGGFVKVLYQFGGHTFVSWNMGKRSVLVNCWA